MQGEDSTRDPIPVLLVVGVRLYREGLEMTLKAQPHLRVVGSVATLLEAQNAIPALQPAIVVIDVSLPDVGRAIRDIRHDGAGPRILALAVREDIGTILDYAEAGADGFVTANGAVAELVEAIERTAAGELLCSPRIAAQLLRRAAHSEQTPEAAAGPPLTIREHQVFSLLKKGLSNKEIADALRIAEATVKNHVHHVLEKLQVTSRAQAVAAWLHVERGAAAPSGVASGQFARSRPVHN
jgi:two-component system, NarL family, nitrate/nitrite response regulator NarL